jgi:hypothetical protein
VSGWPERCQLAHAFLWQYSDKRLKLAQLLGQLGVFLTWLAPPSRSCSPSIIADLGFAGPERERGPPTAYIALP